jgi:hypothetical protein
MLTLVPRTLPEPRERETTTGTHLIAPQAAKSTLGHSSRPGAAQIVEECSSHPDIAQIVRECLSCSDMARVVQGSSPPWNRGICRPSRGGLSHPGNMRVIHRRCQQAQRTGGHLEKDEGGGARDKKANICHVTVCQLAKSVK